MRTANGSLNMKHASCASNVKEETMDEETKELTAYEQDVIAVLDEIKTLFLKKNRGYNGENPLLNFIVGGRLLYGDGSLAGCFETLKAYMTKHVANVYSHTIYAPGLDESCRDIATYMVIATVLKRQHNMQTQYKEAQKTAQEETVQKASQEEVKSEDVVKPEVVENAD